MSTMMRKADSSNDGEKNPFWHEIWQDLGPNPPKILSLLLDLHASESTQPGRSSRLDPNVHSNCAYREDNH